MFDLFRSRDKAVRAFLVFLLGLVALSMVTYLIPTTGTGVTTGDDAVVAKIGSQKITAQEVTRTIQRMTQNRQVPPELLAVYAPQVIQQMINERAMAWKAADLGMKVTADETDNSIIDSIPAQYVKDGKVDSATLSAVLQNAGTTLAELKENTARQLLVGRLESLIAGGVVVSNPEVEKEFHQRNDKVKIQYVVLNAGAFEKESQPTDAEIQSWYDANKQTFQIPDKRSLAVIALDPSKVGNQIQVTDAQLHQLYNDRQADYQVPERVQARHILLKSDASNDAAVKAKAQDLLKQIKGGGDFARLAKDKSEDTGSAVNGGELGWIVRGQTVPEFEKSAFSLKVGETSDLVKTQYGYHIIQVEAHDQAHLKPFDEVKGELIAVYQKQAASQLMQSLSEKAIAGLRQDPTHPEKTAEAVGGTLLAVADAAKDPIPGMGMVKDLSDAVAALHKGEVTLGPIAAPNGQALVAVVTDFVPAHPATLDEVRGDVRAKAQDSKAQKVIAARSDELASRVQSMGGDLEKAAKSMSLTVKTSTDVSRADAIEGMGTAGGFPEIFTKPVGSIAGPLAVPGGKAIAKVLSDTLADESLFAAQRQKIMDDLHQKKTQERATFFEQGLRQSLTDSGKLKINQEVIDRILASYRQRS